MSNDSGSKRRVLTVFVLAMLNVAVICTLRGLPLLAKEGLPLVFYYIAAAVIFLIPVSLITAELATGWPPRGPGGIYIWVKEALGERWGFLAIWLQWIQNVIWFPTVLSFLAATVAYLFDPNLASNKVYMICVVLVAYWGGTYLNFRGMKTSGVIGTVGVIGGVFLPGILIISLAAIWLITGKASEITFSWQGLFPDITNINSMVLLAGALLIFSGIEVSAVHAEDVKNPKRDYPRATFLAAAIAIIILILGSLAIAIVVPQKDISLVAGIMEAFTLFLDHFGLKWLIPLIAIFIALGSLGELCSWIIGPSKGLFTTAKDGNLPPFLQHVNKHGVPTHILIVQAAIVTCLAFIFLLMPTVSSSYWILSALCILLYLIMYVLFYISAIKLRYSKPNVPRPYKVPGGNLGMWIVAGIGLLGAMFTFIIGFFPPSQLKTGNIYFYEGFLITGVIVLCLV
ncbi:MAG: amino acid permease, partial [Candidatus Omnitrophica bacterium]|nr:amino acid permease [Candidatus Omnitrophota bacterium]